MLGFSAVLKKRQNRLPFAVCKFPAALRGGEVSPYGRYTVTPYPLYRGLHPPVNSRAMPELLRIIPF